MMIGEIRVGGVKIEDKNNLYFILEIERQVLLTD